MTTIDARYRDATLPVDARVADLLARMTLDEKLAQLGSIWSFELFRSEAELDPERVRERLADGIGHISRVAGATNLGPTAAAEAGNAIQRFLVEETRLGIPALLHEETLHGLLARDAPIYQQSIGAAAAFDPELVEAIATAIRRRMRAIGATVALAPVLDICRDPRWGRVEETYGEDPYLAAVLGSAYVRGLQGTDLATGVAATAKHFAGHGLAEGGFNQAPAHIGPRELREEQLLPFEAAVRGAGIASVMPAYCDVDGVPCHVSRELLTTILRDEWGFDGVVASDYTAVQMLVTEHRLTPDLGTAAAMALRAGMDSELPVTAAYGAPLREAIEDGRVDVLLVDLAVERLLRLKFRLGLFERPYVDPPTLAALASLDADERGAGPGPRPALGRARRERRDAAARGVERRDGSPSSARSRTAPATCSATTPTCSTSRRCARCATGRTRSASRRTTSSTRSTSCPGSRRSSTRSATGSARERITYARGVGLRDGDDAGIAEAVAVARDAEVAIVVVGERSGLTDDATAGESRDRRDLGLLGRQQELVEAVVATGTPTVLVVVSGRPAAIEWAAEHCAAVLLAWVPGDSGPAAIAEVLAGDVDPGGRLPVTVPRDVGQVPLTYRHHPTGGKSNWKVDYVDGPSSPLWPFGHGRSYASFAIDHLRVDRSILETAGDVVTIRVDVTNTASRAGDEVVQLYVRDEEASVARPVKELLGFRRLHLEAGECRTVAFRLSTEQLAYLDADFRRVVEAGTIRIFVGRSSADLPLSAELALVGPTVELVDRHDYVTATSVE